MSKSKHGGARPGAGRPRKAPGATTVWISADTNATLRGAALRPGESRSAFVAAAIAELAARRASGVEPEAAARLATALLTGPLRGAVIASPSGEIPLGADQRAAVVGCLCAADGVPTELHLDVGGTPQRPAWRVVIAIGTVFEDSRA